MMQSQLVFPRNDNADCDRLAPTSSGTSVGSLDDLILLRAFGSVQLGSHRPQLLDGLGAAFIDTVYAWDACDCLHDMSGTAQGRDSCLKLVD